MKRILVFSYIFFLTMFFLDAAVNLSIACWEWTAGWEDFNLSHIIFRFIRAEAIAFHLD